jgi:NAD(P)-dependent dehydrogenase (short-subunit alcohol dehydrogenase family)
MGGRSVDFGVRIVAINPGAIMTDRIVTMMRKRANDRLGSADRWQELLKPLPFGRAGKPEEIGDMVAFLASDRSGYTSGTVITIDGGSVNRGGVF